MELPSTLFQQLRWMRGKASKYLFGECDLMFPMSFSFKNKFIVKDQMFHIINEAKISTTIILDSDKKFHLHYKKGTWMLWKLPDDIRYFSYEESYDMFVIKVIVQN